MAEWLILPVSDNEVFNYFFTMMIGWGVFLVPINWLFRIASRS